MVEKRAWFGIGLGVLVFVILAAIFGDFSNTGNIVGSLNNTNQSCIDSDGGINLALRGTATDGVISGTDYCTSNNQVMEYYCSIKVISSVDVISVNDISTSMKCSNGTYGTDPNCYFNRSYCEDPCGGVWDGPINVSKDATKAFIDILLNNPSFGNRVGLVGYSTNAELINTHVLSTDSITLKAEVDSWVANGGTCICCGINRAKDMMNQSSLSNSSLSNKSRSILLMSDGSPTYYCSNFDDYTGAGTGSSVDQVDITWAINAAANAYNNYGIIVNTIGFGEQANQTILQQIAAAGHGTYYYGNINNIVEVYKQAATDVFKDNYLGGLSNVKNEQLSCSSGQSCVSGACKIVQPKPKFKEVISSLFS